MDFIKQWILTISTTLIIAIIFSILSPKGNMGRFFKVMLAIFIFVSFVYPMKYADFDDIAFPAFNLDEAQSLQNDAYENVIKTSINSKLKSGGYNNTAVNIKIKCNGEEISVRSLNIGIPEEYDKDAVKKYVFENMGFNAEVYYIGE